MHKKIKKKIIILSISSLLLILITVIVFSLSINALIFNSNDNISYFFNNLPSILLDDELFQNYYNKKQYNLDISNYSIAINLDIEKKTISGETCVKGTFHQAPEDIYLNFYDNMQIDELLLNDKKTTYNRESTGLLIENKTNTDTFEVFIKYNGTPKQLGLGSFNFAEDNGSPVVYTLNEPVFASTWFPCNDLPTDKALLDIKITADSNLFSVSNGVLIDVETVDGKSTYHWKSEYPISTYLIAFCTADYSNFNDKYISQSNDTIPLNYYVFKGKEEKAERDFEIHQAAMKFFENAFGEYPFKNEKYGVAEFLWEYGAMENQTITGISSNMVTGHKMFTDVLVHELAHQWWGNAVGLENWKEIWLNEGFATYSEALYFEAISGSDALQSTMVSKINKFDNTRLYNPKLNMLSRTIYDKGAWVLHMLRKEIGDKTFFELLRNYYQDYKYKNASTKDLKMLAEKLSGKNLTRFFDQWVYKGEGIIELGYKWDQDFAASNKVVLEITQDQKEYEKYSFPIDITLVNYNTVLIDTTVFVNSVKHQFEFFVKDSVSQIKLDDNNWLLAQISEAN